MGVVSYEVAGEEPSLSRSRRRSGARSRHSCRSSASAGHVHKGARRLDARRLSLSIPQVSRIRKRFETGCVEGLADQPRPGRGNNVPEALVRQVVATVRVPRRAATRLGPRGNSVATLVWATRPSPSVAESRSTGRQPWGGSGAEGAAEALGVPPSTLESRIRRLGIDKHAFRRKAQARREPAE